MVAAVGFQPFIERQNETGINWQSDTFKVALTNTAPNVADDDLADIIEIAAGNGYTAGGPTVNVSASAQTAGTFNVTIDDLDPAVTASGGSIGPFRYLVLYDDTHANDALICYWDYGSNLTLNAGDSISFNFADPAYVVAPA